MSAQIVNVDVGKDSLIRYLDSNGAQQEIRQSELQSLMFAMAAYPKASRASEFTVFDPYAGDRVVIDWLDADGERKQTPIDFSLRHQNGQSTGKLVVAVAGRVVWNSEVGFRIPVQGSLAELKQS